jgi:serine phosphatase RsbU (regulator of sigma subunit)/PAS domain-containing protein
VALEAAEMETATTSRGTPAASGDPEVRPRRPDKHAGAGLARGALSGERSWWAGAVVGIASLGIVTGIAHLADLQGKQGLAALYLIAVVVTTLVGGLWVGLAAAGLATLAYVYIFVPPFDSLHVDAGSRVTVLVAAVAFVLGVVILDQVLTRERRIRRASEAALAAHARSEKALRESEERLRLVLDSARISTWSWDLDSGRIAWREAPEPVADLPPGTFPATFDSFIEHVHPDDKHIVMGAVEKAIGAGGSYEAEYRFTLPDGRARWLAAEGNVVRDEQGHPVRMVGLARDVTERRRRDETLAFRAEASAELAGSLDYERTLRRVARLAVPRLADCCVVDIVDEESDIHQLEIVHVHPEQEHLVRELEARYGSDPGLASSPVGTVVRNGRPLLVPSVSVAFLAGMARDEQHLAGLRRLGLTSLMIVPLSARGRIAGALTFLAAESGRRYDAADLALAEDLSRLAALAIDNARLYRQRSDVARTLQRSLLPPALPQVPGVEAAARYRASGAAMEVGGDFYDLFELPEGGWAAVIGDVCGKGPVAAAVTGLARHTIRAAAIREHRPSRVLATLNEVILRDVNETTFCTVACAVLSPAGTSVRARVACGGHPLPFVVRANGDVVRVGAHGTLLGAFSDVILADEDLVLDRDDALLLYTDGLVERFGRDLALGEERVADVLRKSVGKPAEEVADRIESLLVEGPSERDDVAFLLLRVAS